MDPMGLRVTKNVYFLLSTHIKQLLFVTFCAMIEGNGSLMVKDSDGLLPYGQTDMNVEIVI